MAIRNELTIGQDARYNNMTMYRKVDNIPFNPQYSFDENDELTIGSNITVNYIEYYKNSLGEIVPELTKYKNYVVPNRVTTYKTIVVVDKPATYYEAGEIMPDQTVAIGSELKAPEINHTETVVDKPEWLAAKRWFLSVARTPITAPYGIMDGIEATLAGLPMDLPNGYVLQGPL